MDELIQCSERGDEVAARPPWPVANEARCSAALAADLYRQCQLSQLNQQSLHLALFVDSGWLPTHIHALPSPFSSRCVHSRSNRVRDRHALQGDESPLLSLREDSWLRLTEYHISLGRYDSI